LDLQETVAQRLHRQDLHFADGFAGEEIWDGSDQNIRGRSGLGGGFPNTVASYSQPIEHPYPNISTTSLTSAAHQAPGTSALISTTTLDPQSFPINFSHGVLTSGLGSTWNCGHFGPLPLLAGDDLFQFSYDPWLDEMAFILNAPLQRQREVQITANSIYDIGAGVPRGHGCSSMGYDLGRCFTSGVSQPRQELWHAFSPPSAGQTTSKMSQNSSSRITATSPTSSLSESDQRPLDSNSVGNLPGIRAYTCRDCGAAYPSRTKLRHHRRYHTHRYKCDFPRCRWAFSLRSMLDRHSKSVHGQGEHWTCSHCGKSYKRKDNMQKHVRNKHGSLRSTKATSESA